MKTKLILSCLILITLGGCANPGQHEYSHKDVGKSTLVEFGTVIASREVHITGENTGAGALLGAGVGGGAGSYIGGGTGNIWAIAGGALLGGIAGAVTEQNISNRNGIEYTITKENGQTLTIVQNKEENEVLLPVGSRVIVQTSGTYQRVLPATNLPTQIQRPQGVKVVN